MSSPSSSSSRAPVQDWTYDVFLTYHDEDMGRRFADYLYSALKRVGHDVYFNDHKLTTEDHTNSSVLQAIEKSRSSIIVFSNNFDASTWFLEQMEKILDCGKTIKQVVVPVFYDVDHSDQKGFFGQAIEDLIARNILTEDELLRYREVLIQAANWSGYYCQSHSRNERECLHNILLSLSCVINEEQLIYITDSPVGIEARVKDVIALFNKGQTEKTMIVGIWGMDGVGKTAIAAATYNQMGCTFDCKSFLSNVNETWKQGDDGLVSLLRQFLSDIYRTEIQIDTVESGKMMLQESLCSKKIFVVLDNVNELEQLNALCGSREWFGHGSRIIITTRNRQLLESFQVDDVYRMKCMDNTESLELFSWHAFKTLRPMESYANLCRDFVQYCGGLPLALRELGSFLRDRSVAQWKSALESLKTSPPRACMAVLEVSYWDLDSSEKDIFLRITTSFIGMNKDRVIQILNYSWRYQSLRRSVL